MIILAIDSSGAAASAAVTDGTKPLALFSSASQKKHSATLLPMVEKVLECAGKSVADVDAFGVNVGPGSFTGVRIGVSLVKGLACGSGKPVVAVSSLGALAENLRDFGGVACPVMDARRGQFYNALFKDGQRLTSDRIITAEELKAELAGFGGEEIRLAGDGADLARELIGNSAFVPTSRSAELSSGYSTALCALRQIDAGENVYTDETIQPVYLRMSQAERERKERIENGK